MSSFIKCGKKKVKHDNWVTYTSGVCQCGVNLCTVKVTVLVNKYRFIDDNPSSGFLSFWLKWPDTACAPAHAEHTYIHTHTKLNKLGASLAAPGYWEVPQPVRRRAERGVLSSAAHCPWSKLAITLVTFHISIFKACSLALVNSILVVTVITGGCSKLVSQQKTHTGRSKDKQEQVPVSKKEKKKTQKGKELSPSKNHGCLLHSLWPLRFLHSPGVATVHFAVKATKLHNTCRTWMRSAGLCGRSAGLAWPPRSAAVSYADWCCARGWGNGWGLPRRPPPGAAGSTAGV